MMKQNLLVSHLGALRFNVVEALRVNRLEILIYCHFTH